MEASTISLDEAESEKSDFFIKLDEELQIATKAVVQSQQQIEEMKQQLDAFKNLSSELEGKNNHISSLELELLQFKDLQAVNSKATSDAIDVLNKLRLEMEIKDEQLRTELEIADVLTQQLEIGKIQMQELKDDLSRGGERVLKMEVEIATLKSEVHKERSRVAAAEAATARVMSSREGLYLAVKEFAIEAMKSKAEVRMLKELQAESESHNVINAPTEDNELKLLKQKLGAANSEIDELRLSLQEAETVGAKARLLNELKVVDNAMFDASPESNEVASLKQKLASANAEIHELWVSLEEAETAKAEAMMLNELKVASESNETDNAIMFDEPSEHHEVVLLNERLLAAYAENDELQLSLKEAEADKVEATMLVELKIASESDIVNEVKLLNEKLRAANVEIDKLRVSLKEAEMAKNEAKILSKLKVSSDIENVMLDVPPQDNGIEFFKEKLETANVEIDELRVTLEETVKRAEKAERDKDEIKEYVRRSRQKREQRRSVSEECKKQSLSARFDKPPVIHSPKRATSLNIQGVPGYNLGDYEKRPRSHSYVPLYRYLNIKFGNV